MGAGDFNLTPGGPIIYQTAALLKPRIRHTLYANFHTIKRRLPRVTPKAASFFN